MIKPYAASSLAYRPLPGGGFEIRSDVCTLSGSSGRDDMLGFMVNRDRARWPPAEGWTVSPFVIEIPESVIRKWHDNLPPPAPSLGQSPSGSPRDATSNGVSGEAVMAGSSTLTEGGGK